MDDLGERDPALDCTPGMERSLTLGSALIVLIAAVVTMGPTLSLPFLQDDWGVIAWNDELAVENLVDMVGPAYWAKELPLDDPWRPGHYLYRPLSVMTLAIEKAVFGATPLPMRAINLILHVVCSLLVASIAARLFGNGRRAQLPAVTAGLLFAVHPVHFEAVAHIVGRAEVGMTAATLLAIWCALRSDRPAWIATALLAGCAATLFKEQGVLCPALVLLVAWIGPRPWRRRAVLTYAGAACVWTCGYLALRAWAIQGYGPPEAGIPLAGLPFGERCAIMATGLSTYGRMLVAPWDTLLDYRHLRETATPSLLGGLQPVVGMAIGAMVLATLGVAIARRRAGPALAAAIFVIGLGPVSNIIVVTLVVIAERLLYLPSAGFCLALAGVVAAFTPRQASWRVGVSAILCGLTLASAAIVWRTTALYREPTRVAERDLALHPEAPRLLHLAGVALENANRFREARGAYRRQQAGQPENPMVLLDLAGCSIRELAESRAGRTPPGSPDQAALERQLAADLELLVPFKQADSFGHVLGKGYLHLSRYDDAKDLLLRAAFSERLGPNPVREAADMLLWMERQGLGEQRLRPEVIARLVELLR
jgi:hypothetical protein